MVNLEQLGWEAGTVGELDHRLLKAPHVKLRSANVGPKGDVVYCVDLRINQPNVEFLSSTEMHSFEHFLLAGFLKYIPQNFLLEDVVRIDLGDKRAALGVALHSEPARSRNVERGRDFKVLGKHVVSGPP